MGILRWWDGGYVYSVQIGRHRMSEGLHDLVKDIDDLREVTRLAATRLVPRRAKR